MSKEVIYEPHPVSPERKAELNAKGYKIVDAVFAPADYVHPDDEKKKAKPARGKKADSEDDAE